MNSRHPYKDHLLGAFRRARGVTSLRVDPPCDRLPILPGIPQTQGLDSKSFRVASFCGLSWVVEGDRPERRRFRAAALRRDVHTHL